MNFRNSAITALAALCVATTVHAQTPTAPPTLFDDGTCSLTDDFSLDRCAVWGTGSVSYTCNQDPAQAFGMLYACCPNTAPRQVTVSGGSNTCTLTTLLPAAPVAPVAAPTTPDVTPQPTPQPTPGPVRTVFYLLYQLTLYSTITQCNAMHSRSIHPSILTFLFRILLFHVECILFIIYLMYL